MTVHIYAYPKNDNTVYWTKSFKDESWADAWLLEHNHELQLFVPDYDSEIVTYAQFHRGEDMRREVSLF